METSMEIEPQVVPCQSGDDVNEAVRESGPSLLYRLRIAQVRTAALLTEQVTRFQSLESLVGRVRKWPVLRQCIDLLAGYNRVFPDLTTAKSVAERYGKFGHDSTVNSD